MAKRTSKTKPSPLAGQLRAIVNEPGVRWPLRPACWYVRSGRVLAKARSKEKAKV